MHELSSCPRCGNLFECKSGNITQCGCYGYVLTEETRKVLEKYDGCICAACLQSLTDKASTEKVQKSGEK